MATNNTNARISVRSTGKGSIIITSGNSSNTTINESSHHLSSSSSSSSSSLSASKVSLPLSGSKSTSTGSTTQALYPFLSPLRKPLPKSTTKSESSDTDTISKELFHNQQQQDKQSSSSQSSSTISSSSLLGPHDDMSLTLNHHNRYGNTVTNTNLSGTVHDHHEKGSQRKGNDVPLPGTVPVVSRAKTSNTKGSSNTNNNNNSNRKTVTAPYPATYETNPSHQLSSVINDYYSSSSASVLHPMMTDHSQHPYHQHSYNHHHHHDPNQENVWNNTDQHNGHSQSLPVPLGYNDDYYQHTSYGMSTDEAYVTTGYDMSTMDIYGNHHSHNLDPYGNYSTVPMNLMYHHNSYPNIMQDSHLHQSSGYLHTMMDDTLVQPTTAVVTTSSTQKRNGSKVNQSTHTGGKGSSTKAANNKSVPKTSGGMVSTDASYTYPMMDYYSSTVPVPNENTTTTTMLDQQISSMMDWQGGETLNSFVNVKPVVDMGIVIPSNAYPSSIPTTITWKETMEVWKQIQIQEQQALALQQQQQQSEQQRKNPPNSVGKVSSVHKSLNEHHGASPYPNGGLLGSLTDKERSTDHGKSSFSNEESIMTTSTTDEKGGNLMTPNFSSLSMLQLSSQFMRSQAITKVILQQSKSELESSVNDSSTSTNTFSVPSSESIQRPIAPSPTIAVPITVPLSDIMVSKPFDNLTETQDMDTTDVTTSTTITATSSTNSGTSVVPTSIITDQDIQSFSLKLIQNFIVPAEQDTTNEGSHHLLHSTTMESSMDSLKGYLHPHIQKQMVSRHESPNANVTMKQEKQMLELLINEISHIIDRTENQQHQQQPNSSTTTPSSSNTVHPTATYLSNDLTVPTLPSPTDTLQTLSEANNELQILADARARNHYQLLQNHPYTAQQLHNIQVAFMRSRQEAIRTFMSAEAGLEAALDTGNISAVIYTTRMKEIRTRTNTRIAQLQTHVREEIENLVNQIPLLEETKTKSSKSNGKSSPDKVSSILPTTDQDSHDPVVVSHRRAGFTTPSWRKSLLHENSPATDTMHLTNSSTKGAPSSVSHPNNIVTIATHAGEPPIQVSVPSVPASNDHHMGPTVIPISVLHPKKTNNYIGTSSTLNDSYYSQQSSQDVLITAAAQVQVQHPKPVMSSSSSSSVPFVSTPVGNRNSFHHRSSPDNSELLLDNNSNNTINQDQLDRRTNLLLSSNLFTPSPSSHLLIPEMEEQATMQHAQDYPEMNRHQIRRMLTPGTADAATQLSLARMVMADASGTFDSNNSKQNKEEYSGINRSNDRNNNGKTVTPRFVPTIAQDTDVVMKNQDDHHHLLQSPSVRPIRQSTTIVGKGHAK